jgi:hypothetical protein
MRKKGRGNNNSGGEELLILLADFAHSVQLTGGQGSMRKAAPSYLGTSLATYLLSPNGKDRADKSSESLKQNKTPAIVREAHNGRLLRSRPLGFSSISSRFVKQDAWQKPIGSPVLSQGSWVTGRLLRSRPLGFSSQRSRFVKQKRSQKQIDLQTKQTPRV